VRAARLDETARLTEIAFAAKAHWGYPAAWLELWRPSLTFDETLLERDWVRVAELDGATRGVLALADAWPDVELSHLWIDPPAIGRGLGRLLLEAAVAEARRQGAARITIVSDPYAVPFYEHMGARTVGEEASEPEGRMLPRMDLSLGPDRGAASGVES
jgi:GNAT superfamily N-acetyltransferase